MVGNHGNKRLGLAGLIAFLGMNGARLTAGNDEAYHLIMSVAEERVTTVEQFTDRLDGLVTTPSPPAPLTPPRDS
ncbi:hypothetical protein [Mobilicoccus massiliensis]|uniref:hypothetical protein n=1 Tax=Mobilicoccus massiliensis TaxID=1522310 RepID=UPI001FE2ABEF|nr:hypothetical protein [Mobilicoccus massiliensis]